MTQPERDPELVALFADLNNEHFEGQLSLPTFLRFDDMLPGFDGWGFFTMAGEKTIMIVSHEARDRGRVFYQDTLLHEMIHLAVGLLDGGPSREHDERFVKRANEIADSLGIGGKVTAYSPEAVVWPQTLRGEDYYA